MIINKKCGMGMSSTRISSEALAGWDCESDTNKLYISRTTFPVHQIKSTIRIFERFGHKSLQTKILSIRKQSQFIW